jgi:septal ring factor EnvC (AmiA/AmiB activator)
MIAFLTKNWKLTLGLLVIGTMFIFFHTEKSSMERSYRTLQAQYEEAQIDRDKWRDSSSDLQAALRSVEKDKRNLQLVLDEAKKAEQAAVKVAQQNASEAARIASLIRQIQESSNDPEYSVRIRSMALDFLREQASAGRPS